MRRLLLFALSGLFAAALPVATWAQAKAPVKEYEDLTFWTLSEFVYNKAEPFEAEPLQVPNGVPFPIRILSGKKVALMGKMIPLDADPNGSTTFILGTNSDSCGFGMPLRINEWVLVTMAGGKRVKDPGRDILVKGVFQVREDVQNGRVVGLFQMTGDAVQ